MADSISKLQRSYIMGMVKGKNTKPEIMVRKYLFKLGFRYRINAKNLPGSPDIVLHKYKTVIFVNGCFWHGHTACKKGRLPSSNIDYWNAKIQKNIKRDKNVNRELKKLGWRVKTIWTCKLSSKYAFDIAMAKLIESLKR